MPVIEILVSTPFKLVGILNLTTAIKFVFLATEYILSELPFYRILSFRSFLAVSVSFYSISNILWTSGM